jgi:prophage regulatory protein
MFTMAQRELQPLALQLLRLPAVKARIGLCRSSIYARVAEGTFPAPISLGARAVAWDSRAVDAWIAERIAHGSKA